MQTPIRLTHEQLQLIERIKDFDGRTHHAVGTPTFPLSTAKDLLKRALEMDLPEIAWFNRTSSSRLTTTS